MTREEAIQVLRNILKATNHDSADELARVGAEIRDAKQEVLAEYQLRFAFDRLDALTAEDFRNFLLFRNNRHWDSIHRQGGRMTTDMPKLRDALRLLLDEDLDVTTRLNQK